MLTVLWCYAPPVLTSLLDATTSAGGWAKLLPAPKLVRVLSATSGEIPNSGETPGLLTPAAAAGDCCAELPAVPRLKPAERYLNVAMPIIVVAATYWDVCSLRGPSPSSTTNWPPCKRDLACSGMHALQVRNGPWQLWAIGNVVHHHGQSGQGWPLGPMKNTTTKKARLGCVHASASCVCMHVPPRCMTTWGTPGPVR